ncbi:hypothetical protein [uncultured Tateyamaria sp.]|uniref:hypothetical protein n=1 Tax=uncultured Tateyamaria sp. TaxID=455651 RepID=UPI00260E328F|nr:hypothetical protein [uncultured Tateyamaria sp.]
MQVDVFKSNGGNGAVWFFPVGEPHLVSMPLDKGMTLADELYDITGTLQLFFPEMGDMLQPPHGYDYSRTAPVPA